MQKEKKILKLPSTGDIYLISISAILAITIILYFIYEYDLKFASFVIISIIIFNLLIRKYINAKIYHRIIPIAGLCGFIVIVYIIITLNRRIAYLPPNQSLFFIILGISGVIGVTYSLPKLRNVYQKILGIRIIDFILIISIALISVHPWFTNMPWGHDTEYHLSIVFFVQIGMSEGTIFPQWVTYYWMGGTIFQFYPWLSYSFSIPFFLAGLKPYQTIRGVFITTFILSGVSVYYTIHQLTLKRLASFISSISYLFSGYHFIDMNYRADLAECTSFVFVPLVFLHFFRALNNKNQKDAFISGFYCMILLFCHLLIAYVVVVTLFLCMSLWLIKEVMFKMIQRQNLPQTTSLKDIVSIPLSFGIMLVTLFGLAAWWLYPALTRLGEIDSAALFISSYQIHTYQILQLLNFVRWFERLSSPYMPLYIGLALFLFGNLGLLFSKEKISELFGLVFIISLIFTIDTSIYPLFPGIEYIQFPWRFQIITSFALSYFVGIFSQNAFEYLNKFHVKHFRQISHFFPLIIIALIIADTWILAGFPNALLNNQTYTGRIDLSNKDFSRACDFFLQEYSEGEIFRVRDYTDRRFKLYTMCLGKKILFTRGIAPEWTPVRYSVYKYGDFEIEGYFNTKYAVIDTFERNTFINKGFILENTFDSVSILRNPYFRPFIEIVENPNSTTTRLLSGGADILEFSSEKIKIGLKILEDSDVFLVIKVAWFPDWQGWIDGTKTKINCNKFGMIYLKCEPGEHILTLKFMEKVTYGYFITISFITIILLVYILRKSVYKSSFRL
ncbi:MAG: 6-pyruvoyl-tetrahydropterin synthase-related protein [Promethearchaeota archaeon]